MEEWTCTAKGFTAPERAFLQTVFDAPQGWLSQHKQVRLAGGERAQGRTFVLRKASAEDMARRFPQPHLRGLSVTDSRAIPTTVYIHGANWSVIPQGSDYKNLQDYRAALINHELAHVFGYAHVHCAMRGMPADVRQQPSKPLRGCKPTIQVLLYNSAPEHYD